MRTEPSDLAELIARADAERDAGRGAAAARLYDAAAEVAREADDLEGWAEAALRRASVQLFGAEPGRLPSLLYDVLARTTDDAMRSRLAAALARCWVYAGEAGRAGPFADEAVQRAERVGDPALRADALDASLASHWGPDELEVRRGLARELDDVAAHVTDPEARLQAHLWGLHVACEALDVHAMHRQMRALESLGEESPRALFFAASRRAMLDLIRGRSDTIPRLLEIGADAGAKASIPDAWMVLAVVGAYAGIQTGELGHVATLAEGAEDFASTEGVAVVLVEAAFLWIEAGRLDRAEALLRTFGDGYLAGLPRDVDWLLILQLVLEVALAVGDESLVAEAAELLAPYAGRAVVNAGAVMFHGTTDDTLSRAFTMLGREEEASVLRARALATYERIGAQWWRTRLLAAPAPQAASTPTSTHLHPSDGGLWLIGSEPTPVAGLRGFGYLRELIRTPGSGIRALDLVGALGPVVEETGLGEVADRQALAAYRQRLAELDAELAEADEWSDTGRAENARIEREALLDEIGRASGLAGRIRVTGSSQERARVAVRKAISTAIARIAEVDSDLAQHLRNSVRTGLLCSYEPEAAAVPEWVLDG